MVVESTNSFVFFIAYESMGLVTGPVSILDNHAFFMRQVTKSSIKHRMNWMTTFIKDLNS